MEARQEIQFMTKKQNLLFKDYYFVKIHILFQSL